MLVERLMQHAPALRGRVSVVRELHVYGTAVAIHARIDDWKRGQR